MSANIYFSELGQGKSYWNRLRFLDTCEFIMELFSKSFFCKYFFLPVLELTHDPVANVRYEEYVARTGKKAFNNILRNTVRSFMFYSSNET